MSQLSKRSIRVKSLIHEEVCLGTCGLVELELKDFDSEIELLKEQVQRLDKEKQFWFDSMNDLDPDKTRLLLRKYAEI